MTISALILLILLDTTNLYKQSQIFKNNLGDIENLHFYSNNQSKEIKQSEKTSIPNKTNLPEHPPSLGGLDSKDTN